MSAIGRRKLDAHNLGRRAAETYLRDRREGGEMTLEGTAERFGLGRGAVWRALVNLRAEIAVNAVATVQIYHPEDELTC